MRSKPWDPFDGRLIVHTLAALIGWTGCGEAGDDADPESEGTTQSATTAPATSTGSSSTDPTTSTASSSTASSTITTTSEGDSSTAADVAPTSTTSSTSDTDTNDACANGVLDGEETDIDCGGTCSACPLGSRCQLDDDCLTADCESGSCLGPAPGCELDAVQGDPGGLSWADSYSVDGQCYCATSFDHNIGDVVVDTPAGPRTVMEVCEAIGPGPGVDAHPIYNDVQCGHGPANDAGDEDWCPGRVDLGQDGCCTAGPTWDLSVFERRKADDTRRGH